MFVVALTGLGTPLDAAAQTLAAQLGVTAYELRMTLAAGLPAILTSTPDRQRALAILGAVRGHGHRAVACDDAAVVGSDAMRLVRQFRFDADAFVAEGHGADERLPYEDLLAAIRAVHKHSSETAHEVTEKKFAMGRALLTGGLMMRKTTTREVATAAEGRDQVLYLFRRSGEPPWLFVESRAKFAGLGEALALTQGENYLRTLDALKARCPSAAFDDRLLTAKKVPERVTRAAGMHKGSESSSASGMDLLAHLLALAHSRGDA